MPGRGRPSAHHGRRRPYFNTAIALGRLKAPPAFFSGCPPIFFRRPGCAPPSRIAASTAPPRRPLRTASTTLAFVTLEGGHAKIRLLRLETPPAGLLTEADLPAENPRRRALFSAAIQPSPGPDSLRRRLSGPQCSREAAREGDHARPQHPPGLHPPDEAPLNPAPPQKPWLAPRRTS